MKSEKLTDCGTALIWLETELEACVVMCVVLLPLGRFAIDQGFDCFAAGELTMPLRIKYQQKYEYLCERIRVHIQVSCLDSVCEAGHVLLKVFLKDECVCPFPST